MRLQTELGLAYLFVGHDLAVVRAVSHRIAVMEAGRIVETGPAATLLAAPSTDLLRRLIAAVPRLHREEDPLTPALAWLPLPDAPPSRPTATPRSPTRIARLLGTRNDVLLIQGEAIVALEAAANSLGRPGLRALNVVTSMYGRWFGAWLRRAGAEVRDVVAAARPAGRRRRAGRRARRGPVDLVALVHARKRLRHPQPAGGGRRASPRRTARSSSSTPSPPSAGIRSTSTRSASTSR